jgi:hypothetical protein
LWLVCEGRAGSEVVVTFFLKVFSYFLSALPHRLMSVVAPHNGHASCFLRLGLHNPSCPVVAQESLGQEPGMDVHEPTVADLLAVEPATDIHLFHLGDEVGESSHLVLLGLGCESQAWVGVAVGHGLALWDCSCNHPPPLGWSLQSSRPRALSVRKNWPADVLQAQVLLYWVELQ